MECELPGDEDEKKHAKKKHGEKPTGDPDTEYLKTLLECEHDAIDKFDKVILALAGGGFAVSFAFLKDIVKPEVVTHKAWLVVAWTCWAVTLAFNLASFYCAHLAMRNAQKKFLTGVRDLNALKGGYGIAVEWLNPSAGVIFMIGLISMSVFVTTNLSYEYKNGSGTSTTNNAPTAGATNAPTAGATNAPTAGATNAPTGVHSRTP